ncbi:MAG: 16S rRNA (adenine(1518)-N(6)/adenine(1519)-N(6))-dimethyltransferase RsmA [Candidatus Zambryskibacteria bacterium]|nr:16S rRNA (adenine(1518)-N(6)/adenine(1519)-N(6))-dimethyltransferase RsmA [Candidatus Zambryskibacteria bacterium]
MKTKKSLGQHFLKSQKIISDIVSAGKVIGEDFVIEIGPGEGILTSALLETGAHVIAIEKDDRLIPVLQEKFAREISLRQLNLIHADILNCDLEKILPKHYKVVANIPYYITGQIIRMFLETNKQPESMTLLVQKEVAERIVARDGKESLLSLSVKVYGKPRIARTVGRGAFNPQPNVDSAVLCIENISKDKLEGIDEKIFFSILHAGFAHKRKQLLPNLSLLFKKEVLLSVFEKCGLDQKYRAEDLTIETWIKLCDIIQKT